jgi:hypothetical protein
VWRGIRCLVLLLLLAESCPYRDRLLIGTGNEGLDMPSICSALGFGGGRLRQMKCLPDFANLPIYI